MRRKCIYLIVALAVLLAAAPAAKAQTLSYAPAAPLAQDGSAYGMYPYGAFPYYAAYPPYEDSYIYQAEELQPLTEEKLPDWYPENPGLWVPFHDETAPRLVDEADLFTPAEEEEILAAIKAKSEEAGADLVIYTDMTSYGFDRAVWAADFYDFRGYGFGSNYDGAVLFICMEPGNRGFYTCCSGIIRNIYSESAARQMDEILLGYMTRGANGDDSAFAAGVLNWLDNMTRLATTGDPFEKDAWDYAVGALGSALIAAAAAGLSLTAAKSSMKTVRKAYSARDYLVRDSLKVLNGTDIFTHQTMSSVYSPRQNKNSSGSSGGSSFSSSFTGSSGSTHSGSGSGF